MNKEMAMSELTMLKTNLTLGLQRIDTLINFIDCLEDRSESQERKRTTGEIGTAKMIDETIEIAETIRGFDCSFLYSISEAFTKYGKLTDRQEQALYKIHKKLNQDKQNENRRSKY